MLDKHASLMEVGIQREVEAKVVDNMGSLDFLQEKRFCRMTNSPVTSSASCNCFVRDTTQVCETPDRSWYPEISILKPVITGAS